MARPNRIRTSTVVGVAALVALASFGLGFVVAYDPDPTVETAGPANVAPTTTTTERPRPTTTRPAPTPSTTVAPSVTTTTAPPSTVAPTAPPGVPPTSAPPPTAVPPTLAPTPSVTSPPVTPPPVAPGRLEVTYPRDSQGRMVLLAGGSSAVILRNPGGSAISFTVTGTGDVTVGATGIATGLLGPAEARSVPVIASRDPAPGPGPHATITVSGSSGLVETIRVVVT